MPIEDKIHEAQSLAYGAQQDLSVLKINAILIPSLLHNFLSYPRESVLQKQNGTHHGESTRKPRLNGKC
jgi:hypothetical protein